MGNVLSSLGGPSLSNEVEKNIIQLLQNEPPDSEVGVLNLMDMYQELYGQLLDHELFGFTSTLAMIQSIREGVQVYFNHSLQIWVCKYLDPLPLWEVPALLAERRRAASPRRPSTPPPPDYGDEEDLGVRPSTAGSGSSSEGVLRQSRLPVPPDYGDKEDVGCRTSTEGSSSEEFDNYIKWEETKTNAPSSDNGWECWDARPSTSAGVRLIRRVPPRPPSIPPHYYGDEDDVRVRPSSAGCDSEEYDNDTTSEETSASSSDNGGCARPSTSAGVRRIPPPPPIINWTSSSKSILGKRPGFEVFVGEKRSRLEEATNFEQEIESPRDQCDGHVIYIPCDRELELLTYNGLVLGRKIEIQEPATDVDTTFCERNVLEHLMEVEYQIQNVSGDRYKNLQDRMMEFGKGPVFHHNEAYLLANIDALTSWCVTKPTSKHGELLCSQMNDILYVGDIHGGPGGFAEYVLSRLGWGAKVFGYTFTDEAYEYQLPQSGHYHREAFERWMGRDGRRGDGSIYRPEFVDMFARHVKRNTGWQGLHVVLAGGRELTPGLDEHRKELRAKAMLLAETTIAMKSLREGGTFVLRLYDLFTPFTVGLVYLIYRAFEQVTILRPEAGRLGSSERFLVAKQFRGGKACQEIDLYLSNCHSTDHACHVNHKYPEDQQADIVELVPVEVIKNAARFYDYIYDSNAQIGFKQLEETNKLCKALQYRNDTNLVNDRLFDVRRKCSIMWNCPRAYRQEPKHIGLPVDAFVTKLLRPYLENTLRRMEREGEVLLTYPVMEKELKNPMDWSFACVGRDRGFYMSMGGDKVFSLFSGKWKPVTDDNVKMADHTLVYGDIVDEITHLEGKQIVVTAFHIIDGLILGNKDIRNLPYNERMNMCTKFAKAMDKTSRHDYLHIRAKNSMKASRLESALASVHKQQLKGGRDGRKKRPLAPVDLSDPETAVHSHTGYVFLKSIKEDGNHAEFMATMENRLYWQLDYKMNRNPAGPLLSRPKNPAEIKDTPACAAALVRHLNKMVNQATNK